ncbi:MAG: hypothetical protein HYY04_15715 [Chloroflexi bacterium]|nr:hypothetical protein [Chloroflexota bacterium]
MAMTTRERERTIEFAVAEVEEVLAAKEALARGDTPRANEALDRACEVAFRHAPAVPVSVVAKILGVSEPTVRKLIAQGALEDTGAKPVAVRLDSAFRVKRILEELRAMGQDPDLRRYLLARIEDALLLEDVGLQRSIDEMRRGTAKHYVHRRTP